MTTKVSAESLFHYTPEIENLEGILAEGFRFSLCQEELPLSGYRNNPFDQFGITKHVHDCEIVCFCDLPISQTEDHRKQYGDYAIALTKNWGQSKGVTPVRYVHKNSPDFLSETSSVVMDLYRDMPQYDENIFVQLAEVTGVAPTIEELQAIPDSVKKLMVITNETFQELLSHCRKLMPLVRLYEGDWCDRASEGRGTRRFYDEKEWRAVPSKDNDRLTFTFEDVTRIIVKTEDEVRRIGNYIIANQTILRVTDTVATWRKIQTWDELRRDG